MDELDVIGTKRASHPQESWEWPIAVYLYLAGLGAGSFAVGLLTDWMLKPPLETRAILLWGPILVALGAPFLILDLGKKMRFLNAALNPMSSWAARGFLILSTLMITGLIAFAAAFLPWAMPIVGLKAPVWLDSGLPLFRVLEVVALVFSLGTAAYTGVFLKSTRYVSLWNTWLLPVLFVFSALSTGSMGIVISLLGFGLYAGTGIPEAAHSVMRAEQFLVLAEAIVLALFIIMRSRSSEAGGLSVRMLAKGRLRLIFWGGIVALGMLFPFILEQIYNRFPEYPALIFVGGACLLTGGFFLRYAIVRGGIKNQHPLHEMAATQHDWRALAAPDQDVEPAAGAHDIRP
jgi:polysulfide reductase chain C